MSIPMALVDFIPVTLFLAGSILLQHDLYNKMSKGAFALYAGGSIMVFLSGCFKATWKLLYGAGVCDFQALNRSMFPMQSSGFLLAGLGIVAMLIFDQREKHERALAVAPAVFSGTAIFVSMDVLGVAAICTVLSVLAVKMKKKGLILLFALSFFMMLGMGYLSAKDFADPAMNWIAEGVNVVGQGTLFAGILVLHKAGLAKMTLRK